MGNPSADDRVRQLMREALAAASGDVPAALRLALAQAVREPEVMRMIHAHVAGGSWRQIVRQELLLVPPSP